MSSRKRVGIGIIGAGFLSETRARCYRQVSGYDMQIVGVASRTEAKAQQFAARHGIPHVFADIDSLLARDDIDVVDLCVPNRVHRSIAEAAAAAGKHIVCTKPLTAYVGQDLPDSTPQREAMQTVAQVDRQRMLQIVTADGEAMIGAAQQASVHLMYGENWLYAPSFCKAERLLQTSGGTILEMRGGECHSGSHSPYSKTWYYTGGGALLRLGSHPIGAMLHLKWQEGMAKHNKPSRPVSVMAEVGDTTKALANGQTRAWVATGWQDVENWASALITFDDDSRAVVYASDTVLGGMESKLQILASNCHLKCNMSPTNLLQAYAPQSNVFDGEYIMEKIDSGAGWTTPMPQEDWTSGQLDMCQDFVAAVAEGRPPKSQGQLGLDVLRVIYSAYQSAATGQRVTLGA
jgi:predicted dehydrogenase